MSIIVTWFLISISVVQMLAYIWLSGKAFQRILVIAILVASIVIWRATGLRAYALHTWAVGLLFFFAGRQASISGWLQTQWPRWKYGVAAFAAASLTVALYPLNRGCDFDPVARCAIHSAGKFAVIMASGAYGFWPLFLLSAATGTLGVILIAKALRGTDVSRALSWIGQRTLALLVINGAVLAFLEQPVASVVPSTHLALAAPAICLLITALHLAVLPLIEPLFSRLQIASRALAGATIQAGHGLGRRVLARGVARLEVET